jgi:RNA polymerase sigma factor (sigma-70 family)
MIKCVPVSASWHDTSHPMDRLTRSFMEARDDLLRFLRRRGRQRAAEDIVQTVWLKLRERGEDPQTWEEPRAVLFTTAANLGTDNHRRETVAERAISREAASAEAAGPGPDPEAHADAVGQLEQLSAALEKLPEQCRRAFLLNRLEGLTHSEIASQLGVSTKTVQRHIERALRACVEVLE